MSSEALAAYVAAFRRTTLQASAAHDLPVVEAPGIIGFVGSPTKPMGRLLVVDDRCLTVLESLEDPYAATMIVMAGASRCALHMSSLPNYFSEPVTAMIASDLAAIPATPLPAGLRLRAVTTGASPPGETTLEAAAAACRQADPESADMAFADFVNYLESVPSAAFLAAVDETGTVRATSGATTFGADAGIFFVSTDPAWRGRGVATAMTAAAVHSARERGATQVSLISTAAGLGIYRRLGFDAVGDARIFGLTG